MSEQANIASPDHSAIAVAKERLSRDATVFADQINAFEVRIIVEGPHCVRYLGDTASDLRTLLADHDRLEAENARLREGLNSITAIRVYRAADTIWTAIDRARVIARRALTNREGQDNG